MSVNFKETGVTFSEFYTRIGGAKVEVDFEKRVVAIFDEKDLLLKNIPFTREIAVPFDNAILFNSKNEEKVIVYVMQNDVNDDVSLLFLNEDELVSIDSLCD